MATHVRPISKSFASPVTVPARSIKPAPAQVIQIPNRTISEKQLSRMRIDAIRKAVHNNLLSFPSQVPTFPKHTRPDLQRKLVQLYFVLGWNSPAIPTNLNDVDQARN
jgi:hypothetical protein